MKKLVVGAGMMLLVVALILPGCAPAAEEEATPAEVTPVKPTEEVASPKRTDVVIALGDEPQTFDPHKDVAGVNGPIYNMYGEASYDLLRAGRDGKQIAWLAERWEIAEDGMSTEFWLRKGVTFTDGSPLTSKDVKWSLEQLKNNEIMPAQVYYEPLDRIEIIDDHHFVLYWSELDVTTMPAHVRIRVLPMDYIERVGRDEFAKAPVGVGPYKFVEYRPEEYFILEAYDGYWRGAPKIKTAKFVVVPEDLARIAMLLTREIDIGTLPPPLIPEIEADPGLVVHPYATDYGIGLSLNSWKPPYDDKRVRLAVDYAIDQAAIVRDILYGYGTVHGILLPGQFGYDPYFKPRGYDPDKARELLAEAGYPDGFETTLDTLSGGRIALSKEVSEAVGAYLTAVGIKTKVQVHEYAEWVATQAFFREPVTEGLVYYMSDVAATPGGETIAALKYFYISEGPYSWYTNPEVDRLTDEVFKITDAKEREAAFTRIVTILYDEAARVPLYTEKIAFGRNKDLEFNPWPGWTTPGVMQAYDMRWK